MQNTKLNKDYDGTMIVFEGADGVGKTSLMRTLASRLRKRGLDVVETRNVGGTRTAEAIRTILLDPTMPLDPIQQNLMVATARRSNLIEVVIPALERGAIVLCDRFVASAFVFQTLNKENGYSVSELEVKQTHATSCDGFKADLMIHMHAPADVRANRRRLRAEGLDRFDNGDPEFDAAVAAKYADAGRMLGQETVDVDASGTPEETLALVEKAIEPYVMDGEWSLVEYVLENDRSGRWRPHDFHGRIYRTPYAHAANAVAVLRSASGNGEIRMVPRSVAMEARRGLRTDELEEALRGRKRRMERMLRNGCDMEG